MIIRFNAAKEIISIVDQAIDSNFKDKKTRRQLKREIHKTVRKEKRTLNKQLKSMINDARKELRIEMMRSVSEEIERAKA